MTYILPNFFLENKKDKVIVQDSLFCVTYSSNRTQKNISVRNITHVMILLHKGKKHLDFASQKFDLDAGNILLLSQGNYFMSEIINSEEGYESTLIYFDDAFVREFMTYYNIKLPDQKVDQVVCFKMDPLLENLCNSFRPYANSTLINKAEIIKLKTLELFLHLHASQSEQFNAFLQNVVSKTQSRIKYILESSVDIIEEVYDMCKLTRLSNAQLRTQMQEMFAMNPKEWLNVKRLQKASLLLKNSDEPLSAIATSCGYATLSWFGVQFKKYYKITPKRYREQNR